MSTSSRIVNPLIGALVLTVLALSQAEASQTQLADARPIRTVADSTTTTPQPMVQLALASTPAQSGHFGTVQPVNVALAGNVSSGVAGAMIKASVQDSQTRSEPKNWMLVVIGIFLIAAISHRRLSTLES